MAVTVRNSFADPGGRLIPPLITPVLLCQRLTLPMMCLKTAKDHVIKAAVVPDQADVGKSRAVHSNIFVI